MKTELEELKERIEILENTMLESMDKGNQIHKLLRESIVEIDKRIDILENRLSIHIHKTTYHGKDNLRS